jgi:hypothetical protein
MIALALGLLLLTPAPGGIAWAAGASASPRPTRVGIIHYKNRNFRIPFNVDAADRPTLSEVRLYSSEDSGYHWEIASRTVPDRPAFTFRASHDGEYWFAVRTVDLQGNLFPGKDEKVEPSMKVVVDTTAPSLILEPDGRRGSLAAVRWEIKDEHLDLKTLSLEYQVEGARDWRQVPIQRFSLIGRERWDAGSASPLKVRASVADKAGNTAEQIISLPEGTPENPGFVSNSNEPPPTRQIPYVVPSDPQTAAASPSPSNAPSSTEPYAVPPEFAPPPAANEANPFGGSGQAQPIAAADPFPAPDSGMGNANPNPNADVNPGQPVLIPSPRFPLQYAVDDPGPNGPATVELWVTQDGGRNWSKRAEDPDRQSPFPVDLGGDGVYGLRIVSRAESGLGDTPPVMGDPPQMVVEVDSTPPAVQIVKTLAGRGQHMGKVAIYWRATDAHLGSNTVTILWRPDQPGSAWQTVAEVPNTGLYVWAVPTSVPARFHLRIEATDAAGNRGFAETPEVTPVLVDRTRPRSRIIGLDPSARAGMGAMGRSFR